MTEGAASAENSASAERAASAENNAAAREESDARGRGRRASRRPPGLSLRWQLTLSYAGLVLVAGLVLFVLGLLLLRFVPEGNLGASDPVFIPNRADLVAVFTRYALWGLALLMVLGVGGGWFVAGRVLRPLERITDAARVVRGGDLDHRIQLPGRTSELTTLADTFDDMVDRVQASIGEHRRFAANASHELRTPLATIRTMLEVAQSQGNDDPLIDRVATMNERSIALTEALLTLATTGNAVAESTLVDLATIADEVLCENSPAAIAGQLTLSHQLDSAPVRGTPALLRQLVSNLVQNAMVHNATVNNAALQGRAAGTVQVVTSRGADGGAVLEVTNSGALLSDAEVATFTEPFVRAAQRIRTPASAHPGVGLGLALVDSIVRAHSGRLELAARAEGGLLARVTFAPA